MIKLYLINISPETAKMINNKNKIVNLNLFSKILVFSLFLNLSLISNNVVLEFAPYPKETYEGIINSKEISETQALNGNIIIADGYYYIGQERIVVSIPGNSSELKLVITNKLKPLAFKSPVKTSSGAKENLGSTNKGICLNLSSESTLIENTTEEKIENTKKQTVIAKCFILKRKQDNQNVSWESEMINVFQNQPLPEEFSRNFLIQDKVSSKPTDPISSYKNIVFQNEVIFFVENPNNADMDTPKSIAVGKDQKATEDCILPTILIRPDVSRTSISEIANCLPFLTKMNNSKKTDKKVEISKSTENTHQEIQQSPEATK